jgi:DNA-binding response OmpR family regulator
MAMPHSGAAPQIIVADDDDFLSAIVARSLESHGYVARTFPMGRIPREGALDADLVILDAHVPGEDFESTLAFIRSGGVPVLVLSGETSPPAAVDANEYLSKPVDLDQLLSTVARIIRAAEES